MQRQIELFKDLRDNLVCNTCQCEIEEDFSRVLSITDNSGIPLVLNYHYFFPCWDPMQFCHDYPYHRIVGAGYFCNYETLQNKQQLRNLKNNLDLWV